MHLKCIISITKGRLVVLQRFSDEKQGSQMVESSWTVGSGSGKLSGRLVFCRLVALALKPDHPPPRLACSIARSVHAAMLGTATDQRSSVTSLDDRLRIRTPCRTMSSTKASSITRVEAAHSSSVIAPMSMTAASASRQRPGIDRTQRAVGGNPESTTRTGTPSAPLCTEASALQD